MEITPLDLKMAKAYLLQEKGRYFLIDCGPVTQRNVLEEALKSAGCTPDNFSMLILTHADSDHAGNALFLKEKYGLRIGMHPAEKTVSQSGDMFRSRHYMNFFTKILGKAILLFLGVSQLERFNPDLELSEGYDLSPFGLDAKIMDIPGHSAGSIGILTNGGQFFCGDLVMNNKGKISSLMDDTRAHLASIEKVKNSPIQTIYPGHGAPFEPALLGALPGKSAPNAAKITVTILGVLAGITGLEHGIFELMQGNAIPTGLIISAIGAPCEVNKAWHGCEPAMTLIPSFQLTGLLSICMSLVFIIWAIGFIRAKNGGLILMLLSIPLLLLGGGFIPPLFGLITGFAATRIPTASPESTRSLKSGNLNFTLARLWPWLLGAFLLLNLAEVILGYYFNDILMALTGPAFLVMISLLILSIISAFARDAQAG